ncbi:hypothetical protein J3R83DRAFT_5389 [Lanmaoa asiatica]|nr:hypothetical protein J3R83DRAFT_5389 [Lanmaoa asiatica]
MEQLSTQQRAYPSKTRLLILSRCAQCQAYVMYAFRQNDGGDFAPQIPDRSELMVEIHRVLRPGGFLAFFEPDESISRKLQKRSPALAEVDRLLNKLPHMPRSKAFDESTQQPKSWSIAHEIEHMIRTSNSRSGPPLLESGDVKSFFLPIGTWPKGKSHRSAVTRLSESSRAEDPELREMGRKTAIVQMRLIDTLGDQFCRLPDFGDAEFNALRDSAEKEVEDEELQLEMGFTYAWGRKP